MLEQAFNKVYTKFKLHLYRALTGRFQQKQASLTTVETFCMETILALDHPTVQEFSKFMQISGPNAAYKVGSLIQKGFVQKVRSPEDRREYRLEVTQKYLDYYNISYRYLAQVMERIRSRFSDTEVQKLEQMLNIVSDELMPEIPLPNTKTE